MVRWGVLGTGTIASTAMAPAMRAAGHDLAVVGSRSLSRAQAFAASQGVRRARGSYAEVLEAPDVDAVYIALPNDLHEPWAIAALEAGKHVLCEKPLATDADAAARMAAAAARSGRLLMEAAMHRFHPRTAALLELVRNGTVGALRTLHAEFTFPMRDPGNYRARPEHGGGALLDVGIYGVSTVRWLVGEEPDVVRGVAKRWASGVDGTTTAVLGFPSGAVASVTASFDGAEHQALHVVGTDATLRIPLPFTAKDDTAVILRDDEVLGTWRADPYERMVTAFADAARSGLPAPLPVDDAMATAAVLDWIAGG